MFLIKNKSGHQIDSGLYGAKKFCSCYLFPSPQRALPHPAFFRFNLHSQITPKLQLNIVLFRFAKFCLPESWLGNILSVAAIDRMTKADLWLFQGEVPGGKTKWCFTSEDLVRIVENVVSGNSTVTFPSLLDAPILARTNKQIKLQ